MKKVRTVLCAMLLISISIGHIQAATVSLSASAGPSLIEMYGLGSTPVGNFHHPYIGVSAVLGVHIHLSNVFSIKTGVQYDRLGDNNGEVSYTDDMGNVIGTDKVHTNIDYLTVPALARLSLGRKVKFFMNAGPFISVLLQAQSKSQNHGSENFTTILKPINIGIQAGLGVIIPVSKKVGISIENLNSVGLIDTRKAKQFNGANANIGTYNTFSSAFLVGIRYSFLKTAK